MYGRSSPPRQLSSFLARIMFQVVPEYEYFVVGVRTTAVDERCEPTVLVKLLKILADCKLCVYKPETSD